MKYEGFYNNRRAMSLEEVARVLGITPSAVAYYEKRALRKMRRRPEILKRLIDLVELRNQLRANPKGWVQVGE